MERFFYEVCFDLIFLSCLTLSRRFKNGLRPVSHPEDDKVIVSSCESKPYCIQHDVKKVDSFWIKHQPYSLIDMLDNDEYTDQFIGGTIYQVQDFEE